MHLLERTFFHRNDSLYSLLLVLLLSVPVLLLLLNDCSGSLNLQLSSS
jgi:hypothetical protein